MADADEDAIPIASSSHRQNFRNDEDDSADSDDGAVDYRFLTNLSSKSGHKLPQRGEKDFEPNLTAKQASTLDVSRKAMSEVLGVVRVHASRTVMVGQYLPDSEDWDGGRWDRTDIVNKKRNGALKQGEGRCVVVEHFTGTYSKVMGQTDRRNWTWLLPEEALFLLERGSLDVRWPDIEEREKTNIPVKPTNEKGSTHQKEHTEDDGSITGTQEDDLEHLQPQSKISSLPMSLQGAYASFVGKSDLTLEKYIIYANLKRAGYVVQRAPTWGGKSASHQTECSELTDTTGIISNSDAYSNRRLSEANNNSGIIYRMLSWLFAPKRRPGCPSVGPLVSAGLFRDYSEVFRELALIPYHRTISLPPSAQPPSESPFHVSFYAWKPSVTSTYRKSAPPPPSFRIVVLDARSTVIPTLEEIGNLLNAMPSDELPAQKKLENRIKHGKRNVIIAVVDSGLTSYLRFSEAAFGEYKLYEEKVRNAGGKKGGWKGRRGRGGGNGKNAVGNHKKA